MCCRYASEVDVDFVRKAVRSIGRLAIKINPAADSCIQSLLKLIETKISYVVQEAIIVTKDIFRRYPGQYEGVIPTLCENLDILDEPESKAAMIWIIGQFANRIDNADELMDDLVYSFLEEPTEVRAALPSPLRFTKSFTGSTCPLDCVSQAVHLQVLLRDGKTTGPQSTQVDNRGDRQS